MTTITDRLNGISTSLAVKAPCQAVTSANLTLSGEQTVNGVAVTDGDRVLVKDQTDATENGIWVVRTSAWERAADFDGNRDVGQGTLVIVFNAIAQGVIYQVTTADPIVIGTSEIAFDLDDDPNITYDQTQAEIDAGVTPGNFSFSEEYIQVKRYGAAGDGVTDDTAAAQAAMDVAAEYGGAKVVFEHGNFLLNTVTIDRGDMEIFGDGADITAHSSIPAGGAVFLSLAGDSAAVTNQALIDGIYGASVHSVRTVEPNGLINNRISGLRFLGSANSNGIKAIWVTGWHIGTVFENLTAYNFADAAIAMNGCFSFTVRNCDLRGDSGSGVGLELSKSGNGVFSTSDSDCNAINVIGVQAGRDCDIGFRWGTGIGGIITGCTWQENMTTAAAAIQQAKGFSYVGNYHEVSGGSSAYALIYGQDSGSLWAEGEVTGNHFQLSSGSSGAIQLLSARRSTFGPNRHAGPVSVQYASPSSYASGQLERNRIWVLEDSSTYLDETAGGTFDRSQLRTYSVSNDATRGFENFPNARVHGRTCKPLVSPSQIQANADDWQPGNVGSTYRISANSTWTITGIAGGEDGREMRLINFGSNAITLAHQSASSAEGNRIISPTGADLALSAGDYADLVYDSTSGRWRILGTNGA